jgi:hypothetical protein
MAPGHALHRRNLRADKATMSCCIPTSGYTSTSSSSAMICRAIAASGRPAMWLKRPAAAADGAVFIGTPPGGVVDVALESRRIERRIHAPKYLPTTAVVRSMAEESHAHAAAGAGGVACAAEQLRGRGLEHAPLERAVTRLQSSRSFRPWYAR